MSKKIDFSGKKWPEIEEAILEFWKREHIFEKTLEKTKNAKPYVFYDGPPFATGTPHYGHIEQSIIKDAVLRYWTMKGRFVERKWGWDCHGLPVENIVEEELGLGKKKAIEEFGIEKFNYACRTTVMKYVDFWKTFIPRIGRWVDMENGYRTMDNQYIESVWWAFSELYKKGLAYEGYKSMHICPRCETTLSNFEVTQGYKDVEDISVIVKFELADEPGTFVLAWTTTPWTLPGNVALAVGKDVEYVLVESEKEKYILSKDLVEKIFQGKNYLLIKTLKGAELVGKKYQPLFDYYQNTKLENFENGWKIVAADFVSTEDGTGVVHIAPAFGEDDMNLGKTLKLPFVQHVTMDGRFKDEIKDFATEQVKPKNDPQAMDKKIVEWLEREGKLFIQENYTHSYPHCWRCDTPLLNYSTSSWFVAVEKIKEKLLKNNQKINWVPENVKDGRMGKWLEGARDWAISRNRFWGATIPVWKCQTCDAVKVIGSADELPGKRKYRNTYILMRHGEARHNVEKIIACLPETKESRSELTCWGREQVKNHAQDLKEKGIDLIVRSPMFRIQETQEIVSQALPHVPVEVDDRLREIEVGVFNCQSEESYKAFFENSLGRFHIKPEGGETLEEVALRMHEVIEDLEKRMQDKTILIMSHGDPLWMLYARMQGKTHEEALCMSYPQVGSFYSVQVYSVDLHRPYIDEVEFSCVCGATMRRIPDVFDCWFESGSMPYASLHYPFENREKFKERFPAQFIAEAQDQTRGWFYTLSVLATALFDEPTFENVVVTGLILARDGKKMSKRLKNYPEPDNVVNTYGADAMRLFLLGSPLMKGETVNFSEKGLDEMNKKVIQLLKNVASFYNLYADREFKREALQPDNVLDVWVLAKLSELVESTQESMDAYDINTPVRAIIEFIDELSTWYVRRSRDRIKSTGHERDNVLSVLYYILVNLSKTIAPFAPFLAEYIYHEVGGEFESVHLEDWPEIRKNEKKEREVLNKMGAVREIVSLGLAKRAQDGIKVRQPLAKAEVYDEKKRLSKDDEEYLDLIREELNVLDVVKFDGSKGQSSLVVDIDTDWQSRPELVQLGIRRELVRHINRVRKEMGLTIQDRVVVGYSVDDEKINETIKKYHSELLKEVLADNISDSAGEGEEKDINVNGVMVRLFMRKI